MMWTEGASQGPWQMSPARSLAPAVPPISPSFQRPTHHNSSTGGTAMPSRNTLFDVDWSPVTPNTRSRSSTVESRFSTNSTTSGSSTSRRSWMDVDRSHPAQEKADTVHAPPFERRETVTSFHDVTPLVGSKNDSGFEWLPHSPVSPMRSVPISPQANMPMFEPLPSAASPLTPPPPPSLSRPAAVFPPTPVSPSRPPSRPSPVEFPDSAALPATAGHSANPLLDTRRAPSLRLSPSPTYLLGEGRHANVYLASCVPSDATGSVHTEHVPRRRRLCAAKRLFPDRESQISGLGEAFILAKLTGNHAEPTEEASRNIIRLYGVRDERDGVDPPAPLLSSSPASSRSSQRLIYGSAQTVPSPLGRTNSDDKSSDAAMQDVTTAAGAAAAARRFGRRSARNSDTALDAQAVNSKGKLSLLSHALDPPLSSSRRRTGNGPQASSQSGAPAVTGGLAPPFSLTPRIDLLLEFSPFGHVLQFARAYPERLDKAQWFDWARQLTGAVKWAHDKNVLHADIKPQNVLIAPDTTIRLADWGNSLFLPSPASPAHLFPTDPHGLGTPSYSPPEYVHALPSPFSYSSDIFSLGITLYVLLTASEPYEGIRAFERIMRVADGDWWEFEERRRLGLLAQEAEGEDVALSRSGSLRSNRSGRSSVRGSLRASTRRDSSVESVRSFMSASGVGEQGPRDWRAIAKTLLVDPETDTHTLEDAVTQALPTFPPAAPTQQHRQREDGTAAEELSRPESSDEPMKVDGPSRWQSSNANQYYAGTSCPVQYFLSAPASDSDDGESRLLRSHVVPLAVRDLIQRMTKPIASDRPTAADVWLEVCRIGREEGVWA
ncbi:hypothetical protein JCM10908_002093 [Rhodotorula pacifica]|uniref:uncharacterized protein n=1 Tax=Rhodotorula pacifica TaxID=1495444 RepID=UPI0031774660